MSLYFSLCVFLGYVSNHKGYICLSPTIRMYITRHVIFDENVYPYALSPNPFSSVSSTTTSSSHYAPTLTILQLVPSSTLQPTNVDRMSLSHALPQNHANAPSTSSPSRSIPTSPTTSLTSHTDEPQNICHMITCAKERVFKPCIFIATTVSGLPKSTKEVLLHTQWLSAVHGEIEALQNNNTWVLTSLPPGVKPMSYKWIFKVKYNADGSFQRNKTRLVAKGFHQQPGFDYFELFSPVIKLITISLILTITIQRNWHVNQININNVFLYGDPKEFVYMVQPPGFVTSDSNTVCKLNKALYGLKQTPRSWFHKLSATLCSLGFNSAKSDTSLFIHLKNYIILFVLIYVDDILITGNSPTVIQPLITSLSNEIHY